MGFEALREGSLYGISGKGRVSRKSLDALIDCNEVCELLLWG